VGMKPFILIWRSYTIGGGIINIIILSFILLFILLILLGIIAHNEHEGDIIIIHYDKANSCGKTRFHICFSSAVHTGVVDHLIFLWFYVCFSSGVHTAVHVVDHLIFPWFVPHKSSDSCPTM